MPRSWQRWYNRWPSDSGSVNPLPPLPIDDRNSMTESARPRVLLVTRNLPPLVGGMERLNWHMADELARHGDVRVIGPAGSAALAPAGVGIAEAPLKPLWKFLAHAKWKALREARRWRPDVVLAGSGLTAPIAWLAARLSGARAVAYVHGLDLAVDSRAYRLLWLPFIRRMDRVIANSGPTARLAREAGVPADRVGIVHPGVELPAADVVADGAAFRRRHALGDGPVLLSVGRLTERKGIREFALNILPVIVARHPDALLVVIGEAATHALAARSQSRESIQATADAADVGASIRFIGKVSDHELEEAFAVAAVHVFPVRELPGDPEGFGMVAVEAAAHGLPTVAFATGGVVDAVADGASGRLVPPGDGAAFAQAVIETLARGEGASASLCRVFAARFAWPEFGRALVGQLGKLDG